MDLAARFLIEHLAILFLISNIPRYVTPRMNRSIATQVSEAVSNLFFNNVNPGLMNHG